MDNIKWFHSQNLMMGLDAESDQEAIEKLANLLLKNGFVKESYVPAIMAREKEFSTGLPTGDVGVAIPHTDSRHVLKEAIAVGVLSKPVSFCEMGSVDESLVDVKILFMLAVPDKEKVMTVLHQVIGIIQNQDFLKKIVSTENYDELVAILDKQINANLAEDQEAEKTEESDSAVPEITLTVTHAVGLHARPASLFVRKAKEFKSDITVFCDGREANAKSILKILALGVNFNSVITIRAEGDDADNALAALQELVESNFGGVE